MRNDGGNCFCPFCGSYTGTCSATKIEEDAFAVICPKCKARGPFHFTEYLASQAWEIRDTDIERALRKWKLHGELYYKKYHELKDRFNAYKKEHDNDVHT